MAGHGGWLDARPLQCPKLRENLLSVLTAFVFACKRLLDCRLAWGAQLLQEQLDAAQAQVVHLSSQLQLRASDVEELTDQVRDGCDLCAPGAYQQASFGFRSVAEDCRCIGQLSQLLFAHINLDWLDPLPTPVSTARGGGGEAPQAAGGADVSGPYLARRTHWGIVQQVLKRRH